MLSNPHICLFELYLVRKTINPLNEINVVDAHGLCSLCAVWVSRVVSFILIRQAVARPRPRLAIHYFG